MIVENGDDYISPQQRRMWALISYVLMQFSCPVMYRHGRPNPEFRIDEYHEFFVPRDHERAEAVAHYILSELADEVKEGRWNRELKSYFFGTKVFVYMYSGIDGYVDSKTSKLMAEKAAKYFMEKIEKMRDADGKTKH